MSYVANTSSFIFVALDANCKSYKFKNLINADEEEVDKIQRILDECSAVEVLEFTQISFTSDLFDYIMKIKLKSRAIFVNSARMLISVNQLHQVCSKFPTVRVSLKYFDPAIWSDEVLTNLLPSTRTEKQKYLPIVNANCPEMITDATLNKLIEDNEAYNIQKVFQIPGVHTSMTIKEIFKAVKV